MVVKRDKERIFKGKGDEGMGRLDEIESIDVFRGRESNTG